MENKYFMTNLDLRFKVPNLKSLAVALSEAVTQDSRVKPSLFVNMLYLRIEIGAGLLYTRVT